MASDHSNRKDSSVPAEPEHAVKFWNDPGKRALIFQVLLVLVSPLAPGERSRRRWIPPQDDLQR